MENKKLKYVVYAAIGAVVIGGIYFASNNKKEVNKNENVQTQVIAQNELNNYITEEDAKEVALNHIGLTIDKIEIIQCEFEYDDGLPEYEIKFLSENVKYEYTINGITGTIIGYENDKKEDVIAENTTSNNSTTTSTSYIGEEKAKQVAMSHAGVSSVTNYKCEFDIDDGIAEYEVEFYVGTTEYDYVINAKTGVIITYEVDKKETSTSTTTNTSYIGEEKAKQVAMSHAGVSSVTNYKCEFDIDDGIAEYEVEFYVGTTEYDYVINATTGTIIEYEIDKK